MTYDYGNNIFKTQATLGNSGNLFENGSSIFGLSGVTSIMYNNSLSGNNYSFILNGDASLITGRDYSTIIGYANFDTNDRAILSIFPDSASIRWVGDSGNRESYVNFDEDGINMYHVTGDTGTGFYINNNYGINANLFNTGQTQNFNVTREIAPSVYQNYLSVNTNGDVRINDAYTFPNVDGSPNQVLQTDGSGNVSWATVSGGGSTSPAGSDTFIQFNDSGSFGANSGLTYDYTDNTFKTETTIGTSNAKIENGLTNLGSLGTISGGTSIVYYNTLTGSSKQSIFAQGDLFFDYQALIGYVDFLGSGNSTISLRPYQVYINMGDTATSSNASLTLEPAGSSLEHRNTVLNLFSDIGLNDTYARVRYYDQSNNILSILQLSEDDATLYHGTGGTQTEIKIVHDNEITANFSGSERFAINANGQVTFNNSFTFPNADGSTGQILQTDGSGNVSWANPYIGGLFSQTGDSATVSATTTETSILGGGVGTLTVPANTFQVGDSFHCKIGGNLSAANSEDLTIRIKSGLTTLASFTVDFVTSNWPSFWELEIDFTIRSTGITGVIQTNSQFNYIGTGGGTTYEGFGYNTNATIDTTSSNTLDITVEWASNNASNSILSDIFYLHKVY